MHTETSYKHAYIGFADPLGKETDFAGVTERTTFMAL